MSFPVIGALTLDARACFEGENALTILPPSVTMFDQLLDWLYRKTTPDTIGFSAKTIGIGATALCLRWGSYLAALLDEHKPPDPRIGSPGISMIADSEMKRINLECSSNLASLIRMLHQDEVGCHHLLHLAQQNLPMPKVRKTSCCFFFDLALKSGPLIPIWGCMSTSGHMPEPSSVLWPNCGPA